MIQQTETLEQRTQVQSVHGVASALRDYGSEVKIEGSLITIMGLNPEGRAALPEVLETFRFYHRKNQKKEDYLSSVLQIEGNSAVVLVEDQQQAEFMMNALPTLYRAYSEPNPYSTF